MVIKDEDMFFLHAEAAVFAAVCMHYCKSLLTACQEMRDRCPARGIPAGFAGTFLLTAAGVKGLRRGRICFLRRRKTRSFDNLLPFNRNAQGTGSFFGRFFLFLLESCFFACHGRGFIL
jgi:hypothetical protein